MDFITLHSLQENNGFMEAISSNSPNSTPYQLRFGSNGLKVNNRSDM